ncbi:MAG: hypothetical protein RAK23_03350 [Thermoplasmata archaeon]|nr:hypothetical protein [Thermoplasmata archaeon]
MKLLALIIIILIISPGIVYSIATGNNLKNNGNYVNFQGTYDGNILNLSYENKILIKSINIFPNLNGNWLNNKIVNDFISKDFKLKIMNIKTPIIDIEGKGIYKILINFNNNTTIYKSISFNGFLIDSISCVSFVNNANISILNSTVYITTFNNFYIKIFLEINNTMGYMSQYIMSNEFDGYLYFNNGNITSDFVNSSIGILSFKIINNLFSLNLNFTEENGFLIIIMENLSNPLKIEINNVNFKESQLSSVLDNDQFTYNESNINGTFVYLVSLAGLNMPKNNLIFENLPFIILISIILVVTISGAFVINRMVKK